MMFDYNQLSEIKELVTLCNEYEGAFNIAITVTDADHESVGFIGYDDGYRQYLFTPEQ